MKTFIALSLAAASTSAFVCLQPGEDRPPRGVVFELFDTDENGEISLKEIDAAAAILKKRDADNSGSLTPDELPRPPRPPRRGESDQDNGRPGPPPPRDGERSGEQAGGSGRRQRPQVDVDRDAVSGTVLIGGGYATDPVDKGRPVALIAAALGVKDGVFRDAFSSVKPSSFGPPSAMRAQANKTVLMDALGKHGITNERLDEVSNYYRYRPESDELWPATPAKVAAVITDGKLTGFDIINAGAGYSSAPDVSVAGYPDVHAQATIGFSKDLRTNGRVTKITIVQ